MKDWKEIVKRQVEGVLANKNHIYSSEKEYSYYETEGNKLVLRYGYTDFATINCDTFSIEDTGYKEVVTARIEVKLAQIKIKYMYETLNKIFNNIPNGRLYDVWYSKDTISIGVGEYEILKYNIIENNLSIKNDMYSFIINLFKSLLNNDVCFVEYIENIEDTSNGFMFRLYVFNWDRFTNSKYTDLKPDTVDYVDNIFYLDIKKNKNVIRYSNYLKEFVVQTFVTHYFFVGLERIIAMINVENSLKSFRNLIQEAQEMKKLKYSEYEVSGIEKDKIKDNYFIQINTLTYRMRINVTTGKIYFDWVNNKIYVEDLDKIRKDIDMLENIYKESKEYEVFKKNKIVF